MVRSYKRKTLKPDIDRLASAAALVADGSSTRDAAKTYRVDRSTLARYIKRQGKGGSEFLKEKQVVFTIEQEHELATHIRDLDNRFYGLSTMQVCKLAYEYGTQNNINLPHNWERDCKAGGLRKVIAVAIKIWSFVFYTLEMLSCIA